LLGDGKRLREEYPSNTEQAPSNNLIEFPRPNPSMGFFPGSDIEAGRVFSASAGRVRARLRVNLITCSAPESNRCPRSKCEQALGDTGKQRRQREFLDCFQTIACKRLAATDMAEGKSLYSRAFPNGALGSLFLATVSADRAKPSEVDSQ